MRLVWRAKARADLRSILDYISARNPAAAQRLNQAIERTAEGLVHHPYMYRAGRVPGTREAVVHPNYLLIYRVTSDSILIVNVLHARQDYP